MYIAKSIDSQKAIDYLDELSEHETRQMSIEIMKIEEKYKGINKGLEMAKEIFSSSNFESNEGTYIEGVHDAIYELSKELDVPSRDIIDQGKSVDEICARLAERIKERIK